MEKKTRERVQESVCAKKSGTAYISLETSLKEIDTDDWVSDKPVDHCQITLSDFALFLSVIKVKEAYEDVLSIILDEPDLHRIVEEVKQSEEWEGVRMNILEIGFEQGKELGMREGRRIGIEEGIKEMLVRNIESAMKNFDVDLQKACDGLGVSVAEYEEAKRQCIQ